MTRNWICGLWLALGFALSSGAAWAAAPAGAQATPQQVYAAGRAAAEGRAEARALRFAHASGSRDTRVLRARYRWALARTRRVELAALRARARGARRAQDPTQAAPHVEEAVAPAEVAAVPLVASPPVAPGPVEGGGSWEDALPDGGFAGEGFHLPRPVFAPVPLDGGE